MKKIILITGVANGICKDISMNFDIEETVIYGIDNNSIVNKMVKNFKKALFIPVEIDASIEEEVKFLIKKIEEEHGKIDVLVNGSALVPYSDIENQKYDHYLNIMKNNVGGYMLFSKEVSKIMKKNLSGNIINISSISANFGIKGQSAYASSKGAISSLTRVLAVELGLYNIRVNLIAPGSILVDRNKKKMSKNWTEKRMRSRIPLGRLGVPSDISGVVKFLLSDDAKYIHGATIVVDGGMTINGG